MLMEVFCTGVFKGMGLLIRWGLLLIVGSRDWKFSALAHAPFLLSYSTTRGVFSCSSYFSPLMPLFRILNQDINQLKWRQLTIYWMYLQQLWNKGKRLILFLFRIHVHQPFHYWEDREKQFLVTALFSGDNTENLHPDLNPTKVPRYTMRRMENLKVK